MKIIIALLIMLSASLTAALAFGVGGDGSGDFGHMGSLPTAGSGGGGGNTGKILLVDASSHLLQTDNTSRICLAGGC